MTTKTISTYVAAGYSLSSAYSRLVIRASGGIGGTGLLADSYARIFNDGVVHGHRPSNGIVLNAGGFIQNGATNVTGALIEGPEGVFVTGAAGTVVNYGTIDGSSVNRARNAGIDLRYGGSVTNGGAGDTTALIEGPEGISGGRRATISVANYGEIRGGVYGIVLSYGTVTNFSTISGGRTAVFLSSSSDVLVVEAGCEFDGAIYGGGGTLVLANGTGTLTGLLPGSGVTVSGSMAPTTFGSFATVEVGAGATFSSSGAVTIAILGVQTLIDAGSLTLGGAKTTVVNAGVIETSGAGVLTVQGAINNTGLLSADGGTLTVNGAVNNTGQLNADGGTLTVNGAVTGRGRANVDGGTLDFVSAFNEAVGFTGKTGVLELARSQTYNATVTGFSRNGGTSLDLADIGFVSAGEATFAGTKTGGILTVTDGTHTATIRLAGDYRASTFVAASDGHGGTIVQASTAPAHRLVAAMAGLGGGGAGAVHAAAEPWRSPPPMLGPPRVALA